MTYRPRPFSAALILFSALGLLLGAVETWVAVVHYPWIPFCGAADRLGYLVFFCFLNGVAGALYGLAMGAIPAGQALILRRDRSAGTAPRRALRSVRAALDWGMLCIAAGGGFVYHRLLVHLDKSPLERNNLRYLGFWIGLLILFWMATRLLLRFFPWQRVRPGHAAGAVIFILLGLGLGFLLRGTAAGPVDVEGAAGMPPAAGRPLPTLAGQGAPNLLFITIDTLRADHLGVYGYQRNTSPWLDRYTRDALLFQSPVAQKTLTAPSFATVMTGLYPRTHGLSRNHGVLSDESNTLAERLQQQGYRTAAFVSNSACSQYFNFDQGFDFFDFAFYDEGVESGGLNRKLIPWVQCLGDEPFFLWLHYTDPHAPYIVEEPHRSLFTGDPYDGVNRWREVVIGPRIQPGILPAKVVMEDSTDLDFYISQYDAEIRYVDFHLHHAMNVLRRTGLLENTLVVLFSDHGESMVEHDFFMNHGYNTYNTQAVVPLVLRHDQLPRNVVIPGKVELVDLLPTVLTLLGVTYEAAELEGRSLAPMIPAGGEVTEEPAGKAHTFIEGKFDYRYSHMAVWGERWKFIIVPLKMAYPLNWLVDGRVRFWLDGPVENGFRTSILTFELYDMLADPGETQNLAGTGLEAETTERDRLLHWLDTHPVRMRQEFLTHEELEPEAVEQLKALGYIGS